MTQTSDDVRQPIIDAVQTALTEFGIQVKTELDTLRDTLASERTARLAAESQVAELSAAHAELLARMEAGSAQLHELDQRAAANAAAIATVDQRTVAGEAAIATVDERLEAVESWSDASTDAANEIEARLTSVESRASKFADDVATRLAHANTAADEAAAALAGLVTGRAAADRRLDEAEQRMAEADTRVERELEAATADLTASVETQITAAEERMAERLTATEQQIVDDARARLAEVDEEFERMAAGVEGSIAALNERANDIDERLGDIIRRVVEIEGVVAEIDVDAIDDLSERVSTAAGEAVLIRIETERFQESIKETNDKLVLRLTEVETQLQAQGMDVESAVQLERLEEIERALIELDPSQFVRIDESLKPRRPASDRAEVSSVGSSSENAHVIAGRADDDDVPPKPTLPTSSA